VEKEKFYLKREQRIKDLSKSIISKKIGSMNMRNDEIEKARM